MARAGHRTVAARLGGGLTRTRRGIIAPLTPLMMRASYGG